MLFDGEYRKYNMEERCMINKFFSKKIIIILAAIIIFLLPFIIKVPVKTSKGSYGMYEDRVGFKGIYFTDEYVVFNGDTSSIKIHQKNGDKISKGTKLSENLFAPEAGILFKGLDGYENKYNRNSIRDITSGEIEKIIKSTQTAMGIKVINNSFWYVGAYIEENIDFKKGLYKDIEVNNISYPAQIVDIVAKEKGKLIIFKIKDDLQVSNLHRGFDGYIIKAKHKGIIIPSEALVKYKDQTGVYVKQSGYAVFKAVEVEYQGSEKAVVKSDNSKKSLNENDLIILNPKRIKDGIKVK